MLKQRVITALVLLPIVLAALFLLQREWFAPVAALFFLAAAWEWSALAGVRVWWARLLMLAVTAALMLLAEDRQPDWLLTLIPLWWLAALGMVVAFPAGASMWFRPPLMWLIGLLLILPSWSAVVRLQDVGALGLAGPWALLFILGWVWAADTGAYFAGRAFGRHKLAPSVSPGKTIEGLAGGLLLALAIVTLVWWRALDVSLASLLLVAAVTVLASVLGDLFESAVKRRSGVKDSGVMLPGHGGMLDRIDSITAALPVALMLFSWLALPGGLS